VSIADPLLPGDPTRLGTYRLLGRLGVGGMGVVYLGRSGGGRLVAVKMILPRFADEADYRIRFGREVTAARAVTGAFTATVLDARPGAAAPWVVTAYLPGLSLRSAVTDYGALPAGVVASLAAGLAEAIADIHRVGVVHRDLKPGNIMLTAGGPRVIDFGIARLADATAITQVGMAIGTPGFMAPEQMRGAVVGPAADVFALGAVLAYAATGRQPFGEGSPWSRMVRAERGDPDLDGLDDGALRELIVTCLRPEWERRPTAAAVLDLATAPPDPAQPAPPGRSLHGTAWLPAPLAAAIDQRTAEARRLRPSVSAPAPGPREWGRRGGGVAPDDVTEVPPGAGRVPRRALLAAGLIVVAGGVAGGAVALSRGRGPHRAGAAAPSPRPAGPPSVRPTPRAALAWTLPVTAGAATLDVAGGLLLVSVDKTLKAVDPVARRIRWSHASEAYVATGNVIYSVGGDFQLMAFRAASGGTAWTWTGPFGDWFSFQPPVVSGGRVVIGFDRVRAINATTGRLLWTKEVRATDGLAAASDVIVAQDIDRSTLTGLEPGSGRRLWTYTMSNGGPPLVGDGLGFAAAAQDTVHAVQARSGALAWRQSFADATTVLRHRPGYLYLSGHDGTIRAVRAATGELIWSRRLGNGEGTAYSATNQFNVAGDSVYVSGTDGMLYALDAATGTPQWTYDVGGPAGTPVTLAGLVLVGTNDGLVHAVTPPAAPSGAPGTGHAGS
jgi:outer membrane protein assembly factor BamB